MRSTENLATLFPEEDYHFQIRFSRAAPREFFSPTEARERLLAERRHWLGIFPERYAALLPEGVPLLEEAVALAREWQTLPLDFAQNPVGTQSSASPFFPFRFYLGTQGTASLPFWGAAPRAVGTRSTASLYSLFRFD